MLGLLKDQIIKIRKTPRRKMAINVRAIAWDPLFLFFHEILLVLQTIHEQSIYIELYCLVALEH